MGIVTQNATTNKGAVERLATTSDNQSSEQEKGSVARENPLVSAAMAYRARGFAPIPVPHGEKNPNRQGWQKERHTEEAIPSVFQGQVNVGLLCGAPSGGLYDVDCDTPEASKAAPYFLPRTGMQHGRPGKRLSHSWHLCPGTDERTKQFKNPITEVDAKGKKIAPNILELRGTGGQTIVPPSLHPAGERYHWESDGEPAVVEYAALLSAVSKVAACAAIARAWPGEGSRHDAALALTGGLVRARWSVAEADTFVQAVATVAGDEEAEKRPCGAHTLAELQAKRNVTGWPTLARLLNDGKRVVEAVRTWLEIEQGSLFDERREDAPSESDNTQDQDTSPPHNLDWARQIAEALTEAIKTDPSAFFTDDSQEALLVLADQDYAAFQRFKDAARKKHVLHDLNEQLSKRRHKIEASDRADDAVQTYFEVHAPGRVQHGVHWRHVLKNGSVELVQLTNFTACITSQRFEDDGASQPRRTFAIATQAVVGAHAEFIVPAEEYEAMGWVHKLAGANASVMPGQGLKAHAQHAIKILSMPVPEETVYTHTGWRKIAGQWVYLHADGGISVDGCVPDVKSALPETLRNFTLPEPPEGADLLAALRASLGMLEGLGPDGVIIPQYAAIWRSAIGDARVGVYSTGESSAKKSSVAALLQQHWGARMDHDNLPAAWGSTGNSLETVTFHAKDALLVIDEYKPDGSAAEKERMRATFARIMRGHANNQGRGRLNARSELMATKPSRCLPLATGEEKVSGHSLNARILVVESAPPGKPGAINLERLTTCQKDAGNGLYAQAMAGFVRWMAGKHDAIKQRQRDLALTLRDQARAPGMHDRTPVIIGELGAALSICFDFAEEVGAITAEQRQALWKRSWKALCAAGAAQVGNQNQQRPEVQIRHLLASLIATKKAHLASVDGTAPANAQVWGWSAREYDDGILTTLPSSARIGWVALDGKSLFLEPDAAYAAAHRFAQEQGEGLHTNRDTLQKRMEEHGLFLGTELETRHVYTVRRKVEGAKRYVWWVGADFLMPDETDPDDPPDGPGGGGTPVSGKNVGGVASVSVGTDTDQAAKEEAGQTFSRQTEPAMNHNQVSSVKNEESLNVANVAQNQPYPPGSVEKKNVSPASAPSETTRNSISSEAGWEGDISCDICDTASVGPLQERPGECRMHPTPCRQQPTTPAFLTDTGADIADTDPPVAVAEKPSEMPGADELLATLKREVEAINYDEVRENGAPRGGNEWVWEKVFEHVKGKPERLRALIQAVRDQMQVKAQHPPRKK